MRKLRLGTRKSELALKQSIIVKQMIESKFDFEVEIVKISSIGDIDQNKQDYISRSPIHFAENISKPILLFHGRLDKVIDINQSDKLFVLWK